MATRRENGMGSMLRRKQRNDNSSPYKRRQPAPANNKLQSSSSLSSFLSFISGAFRRKAPERAEPESDQSEDEETTGTDLDEQPDSDPELGPRPGRRIERDNGAADTLSRLGQSLQQSISLPKVLPASSILPPTDHSEMKSSATTSHIAPPTRPRRSVQPSFATAPRSTAKRSTRPSFPGGIGSYGGFSATAEPSPPPFTPNNPLENSFAANRPPPSSKFTFTAKLPSANTKTSSEVLAEFFAAKGKAPLTAEERKLVARLIAESDAESSKSQSPDTDPYNGVPSFSFLKATFPAPERDSTSPSSSLPASESAPSIGSSVAPRKRRPINYGGPKRSAAITKAGFTLREHQKLLEKQKATQENVAPDMSNVGDKRGVRDTEEDGGGKRRRTNDGQSAPVEEPAAKGGVAKLLSLSAQPSMPSPLRQMTKLNSPSPPRVAPRAQAPSPASPLSRVTPEDAPTPKPASTKPAQTPAKPKPRKSLVADVMRDMLAEDKAREKQEKPVDTTVFSNPYEESALPVVTAPKVRKPRRTSARPATKSSATVAKQENKPMSLIEKIEQTDVRPSAKKPKTEVEAPPPTFTFTAASPKDVTPKARRPAPVVEEPSAPTESSEIEVIDLDEEPKHKSANSASNGRPSLSVDVVNNSNGGSKSNTMLGLPHRQRPSFSLHSPARPSPLREMSVPIEDEEDEIVEIPGPTGVPVTNGFTASNSFPFSNGFSTNTSSSVFSAPVPPPAPTLAPAQLPNKTQAPKIDAPLFGSSKSVPKSDAPSFFAAPKPAEPKPAEPKPDVPLFFAAPKPVEPKADVPSFFKVPKSAEPKPAPAAVVETKPAPAAVVEKPAPAPVPEVKPAPAPAPVAAPNPLSETELKTSAQSVPVSALPVFTFTAPIATSTPKTAESRAAADLPVSKLPTFTFGSLAPAPAAKTPSFNWSAAGFKVTAASGTWTCGTCMLSNPASATEKCTVCDAKKPGASTESAPAPSSAPAPAPATKTASFDWGAAGMKAPTTPSGGSWTCSTCSLSNPASATEKCTVCDAKKPGAAPATKTASFDWGAAGMKAPSAAAGGSWTCSTCSLSNPATATEKCTVCDAKRPGAAPPAKTASFNWSAAGLKAPSSTGGWTCSTCGLSNTDAAATKCSICDATR